MFVFLVDYSNLFCGFFQRITDSDFSGCPIAKFCTIFSRHTLALRQHFAVPPWCAAGNAKPVR